MVNAQSGTLDYISMLCCNHDMKHISCEIWELYGDVIYTKYPQCHYINITDDYWLEISLCSYFVSVPIVIYNIAAIPF